MTKKELEIDKAEPRSRFWKRNERRDILHTLCLKMNKKQIQHNDDYKTAEYVIRDIPIRMNMMKDNLVMTEGQGI